MLKVLKNKKPAAAVPRYPLCKALQNTAVCLTARKGKISH